MREPFAVAILAAGQGTRFKSKQAKVLHRAGGRCLIEHAVLTASELSPATIFVIVGHQADAVIAALHRTQGEPWSEMRVGEAGGGKGERISVGGYVPLRFIHQKEQLGTGHALLCGRAELESASPQLMVLCGDTPLLTASTLEGFFEFHRASGAAASVMTAEARDPSGYGRILRGPANTVRAIVEQKSASPEQLRIPEINTGIYCFRVKPLFAALERLAPDRITGEYYLTDVVGLLKARGRKVVARKADDPAEVMGVNTRVELAQADAVLRARKARELMLAGVTILRPETVRIDPDVEVGGDTIIEPGVSLLGRTRVGGDCRIGACSEISDSMLADRVIVKPYCVIEESTIASGASVGPFSHLRPEAEIGPDARIGNFVEVKKTRVGRGTKAQHLTYLGDAIIGEGANLGAGTITCNYDGERKHQTVIEDRVFVGSGTELVAPVRVGKGAYVAAGSTVTGDVPPGALAIARSRQSNKPGWVPRRNKKAAPKKLSS